MNGLTKARKLKLQRTFIMKISYWLGLVRWWVALHVVMRRKDRNKIMYHFQFWRQAQATLRGPIFNKLERNAGYRVREERRWHGET
jgi:hypothetical protein